ncbi:hypothetical protein [Brevibacillus sp. NRS-1366]|uniref:hypothetical protein n=1 Tax=Brevibacillus sp. NRS-1366 TaxID=3233899 RepID=UPI003D23B606
MKSLINCPCCGEEMSLIIESDQVKSITVNSSFETSESNIKELLLEHNIEFG